MNVDVITIYMIYLHYFIILGEKVKMYSSVNSTEKLYTGIVNNSKRSDLFSRLKY